jgi:chromosome segregation ATPase
MASLFSALTGASRSTSSSQAQPQPLRPAVSSHGATNQRNTTPTPHQRTAEARAAFDGSLAAAGSASLDSELQARAKNIHENASRLDEQDRRVRNETDALAMEGNSVERMLDKAEGNLRKAGGGGKGERGMADQFEDEIEAIERDLDFLDNMLDDAEGGGGGERHGESGQGHGRGS